MIVEIKIGLEELGVHSLSRYWMAQQTVYALPACGLEHRYRSNLLFVQLGCTTAPCTGAAILCTAVTSVLPIASTTCHHPRRSRRSLPLELTLDLPFLQARFSTIRRVQQGL